MGATWSNITISTLGRVPRDLTLTFAVCTRASIHGDDSPSASTQAFAQAARALHLAATAARIDCLGADDRDPLRARVTAV